MKSALLVALIAASHAVAGTRRFDGDKVYRVRPKNEKQVDFIKHLAKTVQLDFWHPDSAHQVGTQMNVDFRVGADQSTFVQTLLEHHDMQYKILFQNVQEGIEKQFDGEKHFSRKYSYTKYNQWKKISAWTARMAKRYPKLVSRTQIGSTFENRPMYILKVGRQTNIKKAIFMDCGIHAREWISPAFCQWFVKEATENYGKDKCMTRLLDSVSFYVLPVFNIDGYVWSWKKDRMWRKNRSNNSNSECIGTDLNRNFDVKWGTIDNYEDPCFDIYCGPAAESEKETKAVTAFIRENLQTLKAYLSFHSFSQMLLYPYGYTTDLAPNHKKLDKMAQNAVNALTSLYNTTYIYGPIASTIYPCSGTSLDWAYEEGMKYSFAFELRDTGEYDFLLPETLIQPTCEETMLAVKSISNFILNYFPE
ncbi:mast cell carboxypeptidase A-like [Microcaecilia unicolor]|uniref:Mast cell carboxypeptidase A-like n=1 Tax=Microcaecilia unicolor TaxID=1415580 RepID=A0A6P7Z3Q9_9AMPH|nr:mast cell carboxypeptidase A-like [Microcaecilia unicolor]